jgi:hypothetical protein
MRTIHINIYKFTELNDYAKAIAIKSFRNNQETSLDFFNDDAKEQICEVGFYDDVQLKYSLNYCQGDGLSFSCNKVKESLLLSFFAEILGKNKEKTAKIIMENCNFENDGNNGRYSYASGSDIEYICQPFNNNISNIDNIVSQVKSKLRILYLDLCKNLENQGYADIEYQKSDEAVTETIIDGHKFFY